jgi:hypothetical protein
MRDVRVTPGETTNWKRFHEWGYAQAIAGHPQAITNIGLITSHGFVNLSAGRWFADWRSTGNDIIREKRPGLHSWVTSQSWGKMDVNFINTIYGNIYIAKVNGVIPWATIQCPTKWVGGDPNPGNAFNVREDGSYTVESGYHFYKQVSRAGQPGMNVAHVDFNDAEIGLIAFAKARTTNPDAFVVFNISQAEKPVTITIKGSTATRWQAFRTGPAEKHASLGTMESRNGQLSYKAPPGTVATFYASE